MYAACTGVSPDGNPPPPSVLDLGAGSFAVPQKHDLHIFDARSGKLTGTACFSGSGAGSIGEGYSLSCLCVLDAAEGSPRQRVALCVQNSLRVLLLEYAADGGAAGELLRVIPEADGRTLAAVQPGGALTRLLVACSGLYDEVRGCCGARRTFRPAACVCFLASSGACARSSPRQTVRLYDPETGECTATMAYDFQGNENMCFSLVDLGRGLLLSADIQVGAAARLLTRSCARG